MLPALLLATAASTAAAQPPSAAACRAECEGEPFEPLCVAHHAGGLTLPTLYDNECLFSCEGSQDTTAVVVGVSTKDIPQGCLDEQDRLGHTTVAACSEWYQACPLALFNLTASFDLEVPFDLEGCEEGCRSLPYDPICSNYAVGGSLNHYWASPNLCMYRCGVAATLTARTSVVESDTKVPLECERVWLQRGSFAANSRCQACPNHPDVGLGAGFRRRLRREAYL